MSAPPSSTINLKALGLATQPNELGVDNGSLSQANNIVIQRDNVIQSRRGFSLFGESFGTSTDRADQIFEYKLRILRHYNDILQYSTNTTNIDGEEIFNDFCGSYSNVAPGRRIRSIEANGNFYFTTSNGIQKISARTAADFTTACGFITPAGGIKALDPEAFLDVTYGSTTGFLPDDSVVAYRVVWGTKDLNGNLILGTPSARALVYNSLQQMIVRDYMVMLEALDNLNIPAQSYYDDGDYVQTLGLSLTAPATDIQTNLIELVTKLDKEEGTLVSSGSISSASIDSLSICTVTLTASSVGLLGKLQVNDKIFLDGTWDDIDGSNISGVFTVTDIGLTGSNDTIKFLTTSNPGSLTLSNASIESGWFRSITQPAVPDSPATNAELLALQTYLENIILELQSSRNILISANTTSISSFPLTITSASVTTITNLQINFNAADNAKDVYLAGEKIFLDGTWTGTGGNLSGYYSVASVSTTQINITVPITTVGPVTTSTDSQIDLIKRFSNALQVEFIDNLAITTTANVELIIPIPEQVTSDYFFQIYRSNITTASQTDVLQDLIPDDEMRLVYEAFPTDAELAAGTITVVDITPQSFFQGGAFLYTDETNGDGILQANEVPPLSYDINTFKNVTFYANTRTRHRLQLSLLGISKIIDDYNNGNHPTFSIASSEGYNNYAFIEGVNEVTNITVPSGSNFSNSVSKYFLLNGGNNLHQYYVWFFVNGGTNTDPSIDGKLSVQVVINTTDTNNQVAQKLCNALNVVVDDFSASVVGNTVTVTNIVEGPANDISPTTATGTMSGVTGYSAIVTTQGDGENVEKETTTITTIAGSAFVPSGSADYFTINSAFDRQNYYFWFNVNGANTNPNISGLTGIQVDVLSTDNSSQVATKLNSAINLLTNIFTSTVNSNTVTVVNFAPGPTTNAVSHVVNGSFTVVVSIQGVLNVLLSNSISPSLAVQETTQSLINVINKNNAEIVYGFYLSGITDVPGIFLLEERTIQDIPFYVLTNDSNVGSSFNPDLSPSFVINNITASNPTVITTVSSNGLANQDEVMILNSNSFPPIDGLHEVTNISGNNFTIQQNVINSGNSGFGININNANISSNETKPNRVYYSKYLQPEAVPLVNFLDVGAQDKAILRIIPLRDSLFVLKEDGVYRISGETAPFNLALFDTSYICVAADSVAIANNIIYGWTTQGIMTLTESGSQIISRSIDVDILPLASDQYPNFSSATFGIGYNSEYSYLVWTVSAPTDEVATQTYVFNNLTSTWVRWDKSNTSGIVNPIDNKLYLGDGTSNFTEKERKDFSRTDYADHELSLNIEDNNYQVEQSILKLFQLSNVSDLNAGDVILQQQKVSIYDMNTLLLKLDNDPTVINKYTVSNVTYDSVNQQVSLTINMDPSNTDIEIGDSVVVENLNPSTFNGIFQIIDKTPVGFSTKLTYNVESDPGTWLNNTVGDVFYSYFNTLNPQVGSSLRVTIEALAAHLNNNLETVDINFNLDVADITLSGLSVSATNPAIFTTLGYSISNISGMTITAPGNTFIGDDRISFSSTGTLPYPLNENTNYFTRNVSGSTFNITEDGSTLISMSSSWVGTLKVHLNHGLKTGRYINVNNSTTVPNINKNYTVTYVNGHQFSIPVSVSTAGVANIETLINNFNDIKGCFNIIVQDLNSVDGTTFKNYEEVTTDTTFETPISSINYPLKELSIEVTLPFVVGPISIFKAIDSTFEYTPISMNDALSFKHFREATVIYLNKTFTTAMVGFASDLLPEIAQVPVEGFGAGLQGNDPNGENYYGGNSNSSPFRTFIPLEKARCRFLRVSHSHVVAREKYSILGTSITGRIVSTRGYR